MRLPHQNIKITMWLTTVIIVWTLFSTKVVVLGKEVLMTLNTDISASNAEDRNKVIKKYM